MSRLYPIGIQYFEKIGEGNMLMWKDCMGLSTGVGGGLLFSKSSMPVWKKPTCSCFSTLLHAGKP